MRMNFKVIAIAAMLVIGLSAGAHTAFADTLNVSGSFADGGDSALNNGFFSGTFTVAGLEAGELQWLTGFDIFFYDAAHTQIGEMNSLFGGEGLFDTTGWSGSDLLFITDWSDSLFLQFSSDFNGSGDVIPDYSFGAIGGDGALVASGQAGPVPMPEASTLTMAGLGLLAVMLVQRGKLIAGS